MTMHQTIHNISSQNKAEDFLLCSQMELIKKNLPKSMEYFNSACTLKPDDPKLYFEQGLSLFDFASETGKGKVFLLANKQFKSAINILPEYFEAWQLWGMSLAALGKTYQESHYFLEAEEKLGRAISLSEQKEEEVLHDLYAEYGFVKAEIAKRSGEACDWQLSIEAFEKASKLSSPSNPDFWNQFGLSHQSLSLLLHSTKACVKSIHCFKHAISYDPDHFDSRRNLTRSLEFLYFCTHDEDHFLQANEAYQSCIKLHPMDASLWFDYAVFFMKAGRQTQDTKKLYFALEKYKKAAALETSQSELFFRIQAFSGETIALTGQLLEQIEMIHDGQSHIFEAIEECPSDAKLWRALGESFNALGKYFSDCDYYYQAIEQFQQGLSLDRTEHELWRAIGASYLQIGKMGEDEAVLKQALYFYNRAIYLEPGQSYYHFEYACCLAKLGELTLKEEWIARAITAFEKALGMQKNAIYLHPDWLFQYAKTLDLYAEFFEEDLYYHKAIEIYSHILMVDPDFPEIHYHIALAHSHLGELTESLDYFYKALHFLKLAIKRNEDNDQILIDLGVTFINIAMYTGDAAEMESCYQEAESKFVKAAKSGNLQAYYQLACLFSLLGDAEQAMRFLIKAESFNALPTMEDLLADDWLEQVRASSSFMQFLDYIEKKQMLKKGL
jgi:tetratricopeptide (TPR) repeat protein